MKFALLMSERKLSIIGISKARRLAYEFTSMKSDLFILREVTMLVCRRYQLKEVTRQGYRGNCFYCCREGKWDQKETFRYVLSSR